MLQWVTTSSLGTIETGFDSEIAVASTQTLSLSDIRYSLVSGTLPDGLTVKHDGIIAGTVKYDTTGTYTFSIKAIDRANQEESVKQFNLSVVQPNPLKYTEVYLRPYLTPAKRGKFKEFVNDEKIFNPDIMYRYHDINFGVQRNLKLKLDFGLEQRDLEEYIYPLLENFYRKRIRLGSIKTAIATDDAGNHLYDVVYIDVVDELVNNANESVRSVMYIGEEIYYPGSIDNMRKQLRSMTLPDWSHIRVRDDMQPRFMLTQQGDYRIQSFMRVVPLCYTLPGKSKTVVSRIKASGFKFNTIDFEIDRIHIQQTLDNSADKYLIFDRSAFGNLIITDKYILGPEGWVRLDDESDDPLLRE